jgi:hypothetical protein
MQNPTGKNDSSPAGQPVDFSPSLETTRRDAQGNYLPANDPDWTRSDGYRLWVQLANHEI